MATWLTTINTALLVLALTALPAQLAQAHLMEAQHGTLNIVDDDVFMVLSLPISAFQGLDDNQDGQVSMIEFNTHRRAIVESVQKNINLSSDRETLPLQGSLLSPVLAHDSPDEHISQLTVMGRFSLNGSDSALHFHVGLYGKATAEQSLEITATRARDKKNRRFSANGDYPGRAVLPHRIVRRRERPHG